MRFVATGRKLLIVVTENSDNVNIDGGAVMMETGSAVKKEEVAAEKPWRGKPG